MKLILGSQSPRRKELLESLSIPFTIETISCEEVFPGNLSTDKVAVFLSELKANAFRNLDDEEVLLTADTVVAIDNKILGKPKDKGEAVQMLKLLSGKTHFVYTGITFRANKFFRSETDVAKVTFDFITDSEIEFYLENFKPFDKAGSYGIQEWLGMAKISKMEGSFYTIMGLPTHLVYKNLKDFGFL